MFTRARFPLLLAALVLAGCASDDGIFTPDIDGPEDVDAHYEWIFTGWNQQTGRPAGHPSVLVQWDLPSDWRGDPFRV